MAHTLLLLVSSSLRVQDSVKRSAVGIWNCGSCKKVVAGGAWILKYVRVAAGCCSMLRLVASYTYLRALSTRLSVQYDCCCYCPQHHPSSARAPVRVKHLSMMINKPPLPTRPRPINLPRRRWSSCCWWVRRGSVLLYYRVPSPWPRRPPTRTPPAASLAGRRCSSCAYKTAQPMSARSGR